MDDDTALRIVIAEDNYLVREGIRQLLESSGQVNVLAAVSDATELLEAVDRLQPDAVLTDIRMPPGHHMEGIDAAHTIRSQRPHTGVVVLSQYAAASYALELFRHGATGLAYLLKDRIGDYEQLIHALHEVIAGRSVIDPDVIDHLVTGQARNTASPLNRLTPRELDVLRAMAAGHQHRNRHRPPPLPLRHREAHQRHLHQTRPPTRSHHPPPRHRRRHLPPSNNQPLSPTLDDHPDVGLTRVPAESSSRCGDLLTFVRVRVVVGGHSGDLAG
ncbi:MAG: response regulator [Acidimicrobiales bacterium]